VLAATALPKDARLHGILVMCQRNHWKMVMLSNKFMRDFMGFITDLWDFMGFITDLW